jgi:hypothetical protein
MKGWTDIKDIQELLIARVAPPGMFHVVLPLAAQLAQSGAEVAVPEDFGTRL